MSAVPGGVSRAARVFGRAAGGVAGAAGGVDGTAREFGKAAGVVAA